MGGVGVKMLIPQIHWGLFKYISRSLEVPYGMILLFVFVFLLAFAPSTLRSDLGNRFSTQASGRVDTMGNCMTIL